MTTTNQSPTLCRCGCGQTVNPKVYPGDRGFTSDIHYAFWEIAYPVEAAALRLEHDLRSPEFLASGLGLVFGSDR